MRAVLSCVAVLLGSLWRTLVSFFFFQAEDGIRDLTVTGVQTCALPIFLLPGEHDAVAHRPVELILRHHLAEHADRKSTRLNSSHSQISYAVFCLKKKKINNYTMINQYN